MKGVTVDERLVERMLQVIEEDVIPLTAAGVKRGNKIFGAAILLKSDLSLVIAETNNETANPLFHGEVHCITKLYERGNVPPPKDCIFVSTHEPCSLCLSAVAWAGYDNFFCLFSHEDSRDSFNIPHDLRILKEVFGLDAGGYRKDNEFFTGHDIARHAKSVAALTQIERLKGKYAELSDVYQQHKYETNIPLN
jgi:tRNA(Arg) A34 adenosine deaminase TadA